MFIYVLYIILVYFPLFVGVLCLSLFWYAILCVHSSFAIILKKKRKLALCYYCLTDVLLLYELC